MIRIFPAKGNIDIDLKTEIAKDDQNEKKKHHLKKFNLKGTELTVTEM